mmetsp:Transcript_12364/g.18752  ORF Transcript_12364/g.18752 Transcript_12364/m.18752 type:complete len:594 (+) Transcript_12364:259-2040(+)|eukprot:CAMPEP_0203674188 /NCGR_PEP_ID=MMETSP0090-20130426/15201_1 /ASSEMBLY_ACC=CAM_ASM_001088 /TAXON_ID=426623 /ORGANISM="Chaetoceros affinis, Strain CCMP159" /LENGTH=593 /DNA_ID=CAMNT_0050539993 /DNA_START=178 /DNA_END=1959 /DNA_ORIENTATION=+
MIVATGSKAVRSTLLTSSRTSKTTPMSMSAMYRYYYRCYRHYHILGNGSTAQIMDQQQPWSSLSPSTAATVAAGSPLLSMPITIAKRSKSSSTAMIDMMPDSVKEAVKTKILDEVSSHDSKLWSDAKQYQRKINGDGDNAFASVNTYENTNGNETSSSPLSPTSPSSVSINDPISLTRLEMLHDPLDKWYLNHKPGSILSSISTTIGNNENNNSNNNTDPIRPIRTDDNDPFLLSKKDIDSLSLNIRRDLIGKDHPVLTKVAGYFFEDGKDGGKKIRPMMVLLMSRAMVASANAVNGATTTSEQLQQDAYYRGGDDDNMVEDKLFTSQKRLAEISEMIHTASLFHDDVIDKAETRRGSPAVHQVFGNKVAILAGDYLLARASVFLARLRDVEVVETMSTIIEHLVRGEVMQMKESGSSSSSSSDGNDMEERLVHYLRKNFYKTASLMANSCKSAAILGKYDDSVIEGAYKYGKHLGIAFQLVDDVLDYDGSASDMGKAALADLNAGLATAPVLFAAEKFPNEIQPMMERKFKYEGDVEKAVQLVRQTDGIQRTKDLAQVHVELAIESILKSLGPSVYRDALVHLAHKVIDRTR